MGGDKNYDTHDFVKDLRDLAGDAARGPEQHQSPAAIDDRTTRHPGYQISQRKRKRIEEIFGWLKTIGLLRKLDTAAGNA